MYSLGCVVYYLCTGKLPFVANNLEAMQVLKVSGSYEPIPVKALKAVGQAATPTPTGYSPELVELVDAMLAVDHAERPSPQQILTTTWLTDAIHARGQVSAFLGHLAAYEATVLGGSKANV